MQQQKQDYKIPYHYLHLQQLLTSLLKQSSTKYDTLILTKRTQQIVFSLLSQAQIFSCGFQKIVSSSTINPYMQYEEVVLVLTLSGEQDIQQLKQYGKQIDKVFIVNLGISTQQSKAIFKKIEFKQNNSVKGFCEQNLDFFCYLHTTFILTTRHQKNILDKKKNDNNKKRIQAQISQSTAIDRLCSFIFSAETFSQFQFYLPKNKPNLSKLIKQKMQSKLAILQKYNYKGFNKMQGMSGVKTKVIVLQRTQQLSPFILSLYYGPLSEQLRVGNTCRLISTHSNMFNVLYCLDIESASQMLKFFANQLASNKDKKLNSVNLTQTKKILQKAYNPNLSKQQIHFHQTLLEQIIEFMKKNCSLLALQQSIANKIDQNGQKLKGSKIIQSIYNWVKLQINSKKYDEYIGLILQALTVQSFWWFQKNQLTAAITDQDDKQSIQKYVKKCKIHNLQQKTPKKDQDGAELRQKCFRHQPNIIEQFKKLDNQVKQKKLQSCQLLKINDGEVGSLSKKSRTIVYVNDIVGYNQVAMLLSLSRNDVQFVFKDVKGTKQWVQYQMNSS